MRKVSVSKSCFKTIIFFQGIYLCKIINPCSASVTTRQLQKRMERLMEIGYRMEVDKNLALMKLAKKLGLQIVDGLNVKMTPHQAYKICFPFFFLCF